MIQIPIIYFKILQPIPFYIFVKPLLRTIIGAYGIKMSSDMSIYKKNNISYEPFSNSTDFYRTLAVDNI